MEESLPPPDGEGNIFDEFDVQVTGELLPGGASIDDGYFCRLPPCRGKKKAFKNRHALIMHRRRAHSLPHADPYKIPEGDHIRQWLRSGKPRPYEITQRSPERKKSRDRPAGPPAGQSLLSKLLQSEADTESELQSASLESNIFEQFNVRHEPGDVGGSPHVGYVCLLSQCHEEKVCLNTYAKWTRHRRSVHKETEEAQSVTLPDGYQIRDWVIRNKPRPYEVPVRRKSRKDRMLCPVDPAVFAEFDVKGDDEQLRFFCLLDPCKELGESFQGIRRWRKHRVKHHMSPKYGDGEYTLPSEDIMKDWMNAGKPPHYKPRRLARTTVRTTISVDPSPAEKSTELHNGEVDPTPSNVGSEINAPKSPVLCFLPGGKESRECISGNEHSQGHHQKLHKLLPLEGRPSLRSSKSLARLGKIRPSTPPDEIPRESLRRGRRPRNADAAGCSSDTETAHQKKKKRHSIHSSNRSHSTVITESDESDSSDLVALRVVAPGEDPSGRLWKKFMEKMNSTRDETPPDASDEESDEGTEDVDEESDEGTEDVDEESDDKSENVDDLSVDHTVEDPGHDHNSADMEFGEEPREDSARPQDALPSLPYLQPELHDSGVAEVAEVDEETHEEFEAPDNVLPSQPELQNVKVVGHSSIQPQEFQGVTDELQQNSKMDKVGEEASEEFETQDNALPSQPELQNNEVVGYPSVQTQDFQGVTDEHQQNSTAEMGEVEEEEPEDFVAPENALTALTYSQPPKLWEHSGVQPQDFQGGVLETPPNPTAEMDDAEEEAPEDSTEMDDVEEEAPEDSAEMDDVEEEAPEDSAEMDDVEEEAPEDSVAIENVLSSLSGLQSEFGVTRIVEHDNVLPQEFPGDILGGAEMAKFGDAHEEFINPWNLNPSVPSDVSEQTALSPLWHLDGDIFQSLPQDFPGENWPNLSKEDSPEMAEIGEKAPEEIVALGNIRLSVQFESSEQKALSSLEHYFRDALQFSPEDSLVETDKHRPDSKWADAEMAEIGEEAPEGFATPGNFVPCIPLMQSEGQAAPIQEFVPRFSMDQVFIIGPNAAGMPQVSEEAPEGFVDPENLAPWIPPMPSQGTKLPSLEGPIDMQAAPIQEFVPRVHMDPVFIKEPCAAEMSEVGEEALEEFAAPGNLLPFLPSNAPQENGEQLYVSSLNTNASSADYMNIENEPTIHEFPWTAEFINTDIASMNELVVVVPFAPSTQPEGREIGSIFMEGSTENSREFNQVDPIQELITLMDVEGVFESELDLPPIDDRVENPEEFFCLEAVALSPQPMQQLCSAEDSEDSYNFAAVTVLPTDSLDIDMAAGLEYELSVRLQTDEIPAWLGNEYVSLGDSLEQAEQGYMKLCSLLPVDQAMIWYQPCFNSL